jgi:hypothetical protein
MSTVPSTKKQQVNPSKKVNPSKATHHEKPPKKHGESHKWKTIKDKARKRESRNRYAAELFPHPEPEPESILKLDILKLEFEDLSDKLNEIGLIEQMGRWVSEMFDLEDIESEGDEPLGK